MIPDKSLPILKCEIITDFSRLESFAAKWNDLWTASPQSEIFQNFSWMRAAWRAYGDQLSVFTPVVFRGSEIIGILPLALRDGALQFLGSPLSDYNDVICAEECAPEVMTAAVDALLRMKEQWKTCVLENVPAQSRLARNLPHLQPSLRRHFQSVFKCPCSTIIFGSDGDVLAGLVSKKSMRRHENALRKLGSISYRHIEDRETISRHLKSFFNQHIGRRAALGDTSPFLEERTRNMLEMLVEELDPRGMLRFAVLTLDERPIAYHFGFENNGKYVLYQTTFDIDYSRCAPGEVLLRQLFRYAQEHKLSELDLTRGGETYKDRFATNIRENLTLHLNHHLRLRSQIQVSIKQMEGGLRKTLEKFRKYPPVYRFARSAALRGLNLLRCEKKSLQQGFATYVAGVSLYAFRKLIFAREATATFVIGKQELGKYAGPLGAGAGVSSTTLSELAVIAATYPRTCPAFCEFQARLAEGQEVYMIREGSKPMQIWCSRAQNAPLKGSQDRAQGTELDLEHCWTSPWFRGEGVAAILHELSGKGMDVRLSSPELDPITQEMRGLGLRASHRLIRFRLLHWITPLLIFRNDLPRKKNRQKVTSTPVASLCLATAASASDFAKQNGSREASWEEVPGKHEVEKQHPPLV